VRRFIENKPGNIAGRKLRQQAIQRTIIEREQPGQFWPRTFTHGPIIGGGNYGEISDEASQLLNVLLNVDDLALRAGF